jgi:hypothetical protein
MNHSNVVKLYDYTETKNEYVMYMEFCDKPDYLSNKILEVLWPQYFLILSSVGAHTH